MNDEAFPSFSPRRPVALIDLVETKTPEANRAFVTKVTQLAEEIRRAGAGIARFWAIGHLCSGNLGLDGAGR